MKNRRHFLKAAAAGASSLTLSELAAAQADDVLPAVISLLLDDDSDVVVCNQVDCTDGINITMQVDFPDNSAATVLELETPGGSRLVNGASPANLMGNCNEWRFSNSNGLINGEQFISLQGTTVNAGRYQIFAQRAEAARPQISLSVNVCNASANDRNNITFAANEARLLGSFSITSGGTPMVRALDIQQPSNFACAPIDLGGKIKVQILSGEFLSAFPDLIVETPGGTQIINNGSDTGTQSGQCGNWLLSAVSASISSVDVESATSMVNPGRYRIFGQNSGSGNVSVVLELKAGSAPNFRAVSTVQFQVGRLQTLGSINISSGGTPQFRVLDQFRIIEQ